MRYKKFKNAEIEVSQLAVGTWAIGGQNYGKVDKNEAICAIRRMIENGVNLIDTAPCYGNGTSEKIVGEVLKEIPREQVLISTKFGLIPDIYTHGYKKDTSYKNAMREIQSSLMNLETDYIDFYFVHWPDVNTPIDETMAALEEIKRKGYIRYVGVSNFTAEQIKEAEQYIQIDVQQPLYSMVDVAAYIDDLYFDGKPDYRLDFGRMKLDSWHVTHQEVPQFAKLKGHSYLDGQYLSLSCADFAEMYTGHHLWNNYRVTAVLKPVTSTEHFVNIRVQGAMRSYAAGFSKNNKLVLRKNYYGYITLCETDFEWKVDEEYKISLTADGSTISVSVNDKEYLKFTDSDLPLLTGCAGISVEKGSHCLYRDIAITGRE